MNLITIWFGRHWWYIDTNHKYKHRNVRIFGRWCGIISYRKVKDKDF